MSRMGYHKRIQANMHFNPTRLTMPATDTRLMRFTELLWAGQDDEGWCVFKRDPVTGEVIRIDFYPPG